jgi:hypothetical protein
MLAIASHDQEIRFAVARVRDQRRRHVIVSALGMVQDSLDAVPLEVADGVLAELRRRLGFDASTTANRHLVRLVQIRHRLGQCARGLAAAVPCDENVIEAHWSGLAPGNQENTTAGAEQNSLDQPFGLFRRVVRAQRHKSICRARLPHGDIGYRVREIVEAVHLQPGEALQQLGLDPVAARARAASVRRLGSRRCRPALPPRTQAGH